MAEFFVDTLRNDKKHLIHNELLLQMDGDTIMQRWKAMETAYRSCRKTVTRTGDGASDDYTKLAQRTAKMCPFYERIHSIFQFCPKHCPPATFSSSSNRRGTRHS
ncbi:hypothetical protein BGX21_007008, partial [Mortierella sp. AD011]